MYFHCLQTNRYWLHLLFFCNIPLTKILMNVARMLGSALLVCVRIPAVHSPVNALKDIPWNQAFLDAQVRYSCVMENCFILLHFFLHWIFVLRNSLSNYTKCKVCLLTTFNSEYILYLCFVPNPLLFFTLENKIKFSPYHCNIEKIATPKMYFRKWKMTRVNIAILFNILSP